ncbi:MAG: FHA domain-containing protein [Anaerolineales bacterium]
MDDYIDVKIDVFEHTGQRARLRRSLTVKDLIGEILREFDDIPADAPEKFALYLKGFDRPLAYNSTLTQLDIQPQDELVFEYVRQTFRQMLEPRHYATLREEVTGKEFDIQWQPAIIGRPSNEVDHNIMLAVNVQLLPNGMTVSRKHAQITFSEGRYFIEPLAEQNPVFLNGKEIPVNSRREIRHGDKLTFGRNRLSMFFLTQSHQDAHAAPRAQAAQPQPYTPPPSYTPPPASAPIPSTPVPPPPPPYTPPPAAYSADATNIAAPASSARLVIERANDAARIGESIELIAFPFVLGRTMAPLSAEIEVSRRHAEVNQDAQGRYTITDLQSTNGVTINGQRIPPNVPHQITPGTRIGLGQVVIVRFEA